MQMTAVALQVTNEFLEGPPPSAAEQRCGQRVGSSCNFFRRSQKC